MDFDFIFFISCFYFFLPAYFANMTPPLVRNAKIFDFLAVPVDFGKTFGGKRIFGDHKTWRGVVCALIVGTGVALLQWWLYRFSWAIELSLVDYKSVNLWVFALLLSGGAVAGDLAAAFIKRRLNLVPGASFMPWDQTNYVIGGFIFLEPYVGRYMADSLAVWGALFLMTFFLHLLFNRFGYDIGLHKAKW
ncbi:MAG: CDP-archaeol synthase [Candidatus Pacebacteria bacterium]|jgi:CDP-2,3-bis-(O-geranylgeranyl)-sn-glycerol synthase|nr:CDP-archaeol synthase [Candidatus Paceibacterota bacterium]